jgi:molybdopterin converting factor small subunit
MNVTIELIGVFRIGRFTEELREYRATTRLREVKDELRIPDSLFGAVLINGVHANVDDELKDGDRVSFLPLLDGG